MTKFLKNTLAVLLCLPLCIITSSQELSPSPQTGKLIEFLSAESYNIKKMDSMDYLILVGHVKIRQGNTLLFGDSIIINSTLNTLEGFNNVHINDADSVHTYAQYLRYDGNTKKAFLRIKVRLTDGRGVLTTDSLDYDVNVKVGNYKKGGQLVRDKTVLKSTEGFYYGVTRDVIFTKKVELKDPENTILTDTLEYNTYSQLANFNSPTKIISGTRIIKTSNGNYNLGTALGYLYDRSSIDDSAYYFISDEMEINDSLGLGEFKGNAKYQSKDSMSFDMLANNIKTNRKLETILATEHPQLLIKQSNDTLYVQADTLFSGRISDLKRPFQSARGKTERIEDSSNNKYFEAYHHVTILSDSLQGIADSLFYSLSDSTIRLLTGPIIWSNDNQIIGDTIHLFLKNKQPEQLKVFFNAISINKIDSTDYYNQLKGNSLNVWFEEGVISKMRSSGNSENIYFAQDNELKFIGVNNSSAQIIDIYFENGEPAKVVFRNQLNGKMTPLYETPEEALRLKNFKWESSKRPSIKN